MVESLFHFVNTSSGRVLETSLPELGKPFFLDYAQGTLGYRLTPKRILHEPLAKVIEKGTWVFDAMGGLAKDALMLALMECKVWSCEPHPLVYGLVQDGLRRIKKNPTWSSILSDSNQLRFFNVDAMSKLNEFLQCDVTQRPDIIYLDPMFPSKQKTSISKKEIQWLQQIHAHTPNMYPDYNVSAPDVVFDCSLKVARKRVIVKRPLRAPPLVDLPAPMFSKSFQSARFDVYAPKPLL